MSKIPALSVTLNVLSQTFCDQVVGAVADTTRQVCQKWVEQAALIEYGRIGEQEDENGPSRRRSVEEIKPTSANVHIDLLTLFLLQHNLVHRNFFRAINSVSMT